MRTRRWENFWMNNWQKDTSDHPSRNTPHHSSSSKRKMESCDKYKTTDVLTNILCATNPPFLSFLTSSPTFGERPYSPSWTYDGVITTSASKRVTNTKRPSKHAMDFLNPQSCFLAFATLPPLSKR